MEVALQRLIEELPPPEGVGGRNEDWPRVESEIKLTFPSHFKELLSVYGDSVWFDLYHILYPETTEPTESYLSTVRDQLNTLPILSFAWPCASSLRMACPIKPRVGTCGAINGFLFLSQPFRTGWRPLRLREPLLLRFSFRLETDCEDQQGPHADSGAPTSVHARHDRRGECRASSRLACRTASSLATARWMAQ